MKNIVKVLFSIPALVLLSSATFIGEDHVTICHYPPGNPDNVQVITVGVNAVAAHFANHGDNFPTGGSSAQCPDCSACPGPSL